MCDYSLHAFENRLAKDGEELVVHRFFGGSMGLASPQEVGPLASAITNVSRAQIAGKVRRQDAGKTVPSAIKIWWNAVKSWFAADPTPERQPCAVCIPPGATLILRDIPRSLQREFGVEEAEEVTFVQTTASANTYRDALRFSNQRQILLQALRPGQRLSVLTIELIGDGEPAERLTAPPGQFLAS